MAILMFTYCSPPSEKTQISKYTNAPEAFEELAKIIENDAKNLELDETGLGCSVVGKDNIGTYWYSSVAGYWENYPEANKSLPEVLTQVGMSSARYSEYLKLFSKTGSERVTFCQKNNNISSPVTHVLVYRSGTIMGGWIAEISKRKDGITPLNKKSRCCSTINTKISDGWYLSMKSTS